VDYKNAVDAVVNAAQKMSSGVCAGFTVAGMDAAVRLYEIVATPQIEAVPLHSITVPAAGPPDPSLVTQLRKEWDTQFGAARSLSDVEMLRPAGPQPADAFLGPVNSVALPSFGLSFTPSEAGALPMLNMTAGEAPIAVRFVQSVKVELNANDMLPQVTITFFPGKVDVSLPDGVLASLREGKRNEFTFGSAVKEAP
jgi:hypothetical protein